ncbi:MAG: hypothetical protein IPL61_02410 [Myxococcales bacterium]|nr:hypothetical protein [Myxococcales bacterium]
MAGRGALAALAAASVTGCGSRPAPTRAPPPPVVPALFAGLFAGDRVLTYEVEFSEISSGPVGEPGADDLGRVTYREASTRRCARTVTAAGGFWVATFACAELEPEIADTPDPDLATSGDEPERDRSIVGGRLDTIFVTDGRALWRLETSGPPTVDELRALTGTPALLSATPTEVTREDPDLGTVETRQDQGGWCVVWGNFGEDATGDIGTERWCLDPGAGLVEVAITFDGAVMREDTATLVASAPAR